MSIFEFNRDRLTAPDEIEPGRVLRLIALTTVPATARVR
jgi:nucleoid-associated protein YgaU